MDDAAVTEHSPFIRALLGPLADRVAPAPPAAPYEDLALLWCVQGVEQMEDDLEAAVGSLVQAVSLGSGDAMAWLGASLIDIAYIHDRFDDADCIELAVRGLCWLESADLCGIPFASTLFAIVQPNLPQHVIEAWSARPPLSHVTIH